MVAPQLRRGENPLLLWAVQDVAAPVHTFVGHSDMVLEFEWRLTEPGEHQLVTWARDHSLRIWRVDQHLQRVSSLVICMNIISIPFFYFISEEQ